jgi:hypothetical protein
LFNGDLDAAQKFAQILVDKYGYNSQKFAASIRAQEPLAAIKKELKPEFLKTLSPSDQEQLRKAYAYYSRIRGRSEESVRTEAQAIFGPKGHPRVSRASLEAAIRAAREETRRRAAAERLMSDTLRKQKMAELLRGAAR